MNKEKLESNNEYQELIENLIYKFYENEKKNLKIPENINEEEQKNSAEDKNESKKEKDKIEKENKINNLNYISVDVDDEKYEKKEFLTKDFKTKKQNGLVIGFFGNILQGKTYFLNKLFNCDLPLNSTETINYYFLKDNVRIIDTPGLNNNNNLTNQNFKDNIIKLKKKDFLIQKFVLDNSIISIYIINSYNLENRKKIGKLRKILYKNYKETSVMKSLYIIHNIFQIKSKEDYEQYVKNNFPNDDFYNNENICFCEKLNNEKAEDKFEILHFVYNPYYLTENIIKRIKEQINSHIQIELLDFNDIYNKFLQSLKQLFNQDINSSLNNSVSDYYNDSLKISDDNIYFNSKYYWSSLNIIEPHFSCFIDSNNELIIIFEVPDYDKCEISYKTLKEDYKFFFSAKNKKKTNEIKKIILNNRFLSDIDFSFKIPIDSFHFCNTKPHETVEKNGLVIFKYKQLNQ